MNKRYSIIDSFKDDNDRRFAAKIIDMAEQVKKTCRQKCTGFLDPSGAIKAERILEQYNDVKYMLTGGVENCERKVCIIYPDYMNEDDVEIPLSVLMINGKSKFDNVSHRDVLGAVLSIGIKREVTGDIIIDKERYYIVVFSEISYYIILNLKMIKHTPVEVEYINFGNVPEKQETYKIISSTIASLRLDCVLSCGFGESRNRMSAEIINGNVRLNWETINDLSHPVKAKDVISLRGKGRIIIDSIGSMTKKGRLNICIKRLL